MGAGEISEGSDGKQASSEKTGKKLVNLYSIRKELLPLMVALDQCGLLDGPTTSKKFDELARTYFGKKSGKELLEEFYQASPKHAKIVEDSLKKGNACATASGLYDYLMKAVEDLGIEKDSPRYFAVMDALLTRLRIPIDYGDKGVTG